MINPQLRQHDGHSQNVGGSDADSNSAVGNSSISAFSLIDPTPFFNAVQCFFSDGFLAISEIHQQASAARLVSAMFLSFLARQCVPIMVPLIRPFCWPTNASLWLNRQQCLKRTKIPRMVEALVALVLGQWVLQHHSRLRQTIL